MRLRVDIDFEQNTTGTIATTTAQVNNVSRGLHKGSHGYEGFQLSASVDKPTTPLTGQFKFFDEEEGYPGWMSKQLSDERGFFASPIKWQVTFTGRAKFLYIRFDEELNEYATEIEITGNGVTNIIQNNSVACAVALNEVSECTVSILRWNKPYKSAKITMFEASNIITFQGSHIESLECSEQAWNGSFTLSTGFIQQFADITFRDHQGLLHTLADSGGLVKFLSVRIYVRYKDAWHFLGQYFSDTWSVDQTSDKVKATCNDLSRNFANKTADVIGENLSVMELLDQLNVGIVPKPDSYVTNPFTGEELSISEFLSSCISKDAYFQAVSIDQIVAQICDRWLLKIYWHPQLEKFVVMEAW